MKQADCPNCGARFRFEKLREPAHPENFQDDAHPEEGYSYACVVCYAGVPMECVTEEPG